jgi:phosphoribosyl-ATP pyrophosphohydrolase
MNLELLMQLHREWTAKTFPEATPQSSIEKLEEEIKELKIEICLGKGSALTEEYVDCVMCLFDSMARKGVSVDDFVQAFSDKLQKNIARVWIKNANNTYSHVKQTGPKKTVGEYLTELAEQKALAKMGYNSNGKL